MPKKESKIDRQIRKAGLPIGGAVPFDPQLEQDRKGRPIIKKAPVSHGPRKGKKGYVISRSESGSRTGLMGDIPITGTFKKTAERRDTRRSIPMAISP
jgi:hypothetical protein